MANNINFTSEEASNAMLSGLISKIRSELRKIILERIEPDIQEAINTSLDSLKMGIYSYQDYASMRTIVNVIIDGKKKNLTERVDETEKPV